MGKPLTAVSLFAGIGGIDLAFEHAGIRVVAAVEIDPAARGVLTDRTPGVTLFDDVCEVTGADLIAAGLDPDRGIVAAGWPCQDFSLAGRRLGLGGTRSSLWWHVVRLLAETRARWFIGENVPGLLSAVCSCPGTGEHGGCAQPHAVPGGYCGPGHCIGIHGGAMGAVVGSLGELGYGYAWRVLDAQYLGVPQRRRRIIFVGCLGDRAAPVQVLLEPESGLGDPAPRGPAWPGAAAVAALSASDGGADVNDATGGRLIAAPVRASNHHGDHAAAESHLVAGPLQTRGSNGRGHRVDAVGAADGHLVAATLTAGSHTSRPPGRRREDDENVVVNALTAHAGRNDPSADPLLPMAFDAAQITHPENRVNPQPGDPAPPLAATGQPRVAYALRSEPGGVGQAHNTNYPVIAQSLTAEGHDASEDGAGRATLVPVSLAVGQDFATGDDLAMPITGSNGQPGTVALATAVRRLTPVEAERLQGLPDGWTATSNGRPQSDSARYRQLGNSVAVPVFAWVARRLVTVEAITGEPIEVNTHAA